MTTQDDLLRRAAGDVIMAKYDSLSGLNGTYRNMSAEKIAKIEARLKPMPKIIQAKPGRKESIPVTEESLKLVRDTLDAGKKRIDLVRIHGYSQFFIKKNLNELVKRGFERFKI